MQSVQRGAKLVRLLLDLVGDLLPRGVDLVALRLFLGRLHGLPIGCTGRCSRSQFLVDLDQGRTGLRNLGGLGGPMREPCDPCASAFTFDFDP